jgi:hypothetical protein
MALFGLGIFNLHYWGFGVPFLMGGRLVSRAGLAVAVEVEAWPVGLRSSSYGPPNSRVSSNRLPSAGGVLPRPNKRYTPPTEKLKRPSKAKPEG